MIIEDERNRLLIGETAISGPEYSRRSKYFKYLILDAKNEDKVIKINSRIFYNAAHCEFHKEIYNIEVNNDSATPQSLLELRCYDYIQSYNSYQWQEADNAEYDIKFLARKHNLTELKILPNHVEKEELGVVVDFIEETSYQNEISEMSGPEKEEIIDLLKQINASTKKINDH